jgi:hypothetical protein
MRRAHLITPFGVGALSTTVHGVTVITASLDAWFHDFNGGYVQPQDMEIQDWRLHKQLRISDLKLPPRGAKKTFRGNVRQVQATTSFIPVLRFPKWNKCQFCNTLTQLPLSFSGEATCQNLDCKSKSTFQVSIIVACENGHLDDFPWRKWVHRGDVPDCGGSLKLTSTGGGTLASQWVSCTGCKAKKQNLQSILGVQTLADGSQKSNLSKKLSDSSGEYTCTGGRPWANEFESCSSYPVALLRTSSNVYFPIVESSIYIPQTNNFANPSLLEILNKPGWRIILQTMKMTMKAMGLGGLITPQLMRDQAAGQEELRSFSDEELEVALQELMPQDPTEEPSEEIDGRISEFQLFCKESVPHAFLKVTRPKKEAIIQGISNLRRIDSLCETRALRGFTRISSNLISLEDGKKLLRSNKSQDRVNWLPAYQVRGEGIFFELDPNLVKTWKETIEVTARISPTLKRISAGDIRPSNVTDFVDAGYFLIHTLSHLLIRQLVFDSGYGTASLRERLYVDRTGDVPRYGVLIYTAAGDSEGTMGGLVSLAEGDAFRQLFDNAIESARWCSTDPICLELGGKGQGPDLCNLAACHACALLPETSCEDMNKFLDRGLLIGTPDHPKLGFFNGHL